MEIPGNCVLELSNLQFSGARNSSLSWNSDAGLMGEKNGRSKIYALDKRRSGNRQSVPSFGPVVDIDNHPCHVRNTLHFMHLNVSYMRSLRARKLTWVGLPYLSVFAFHRPLTSYGSCFLQFPSRMSCYKIQNHVIRYATARNTL